MERNPSNQSMKPTAPLRDNFSVFATTPCRGLSLSRYLKKLLELPLAEAQFSPASTRLDPPRF